MGCCKKRTYWNPIVKICLNDVANTTKLELCGEWFDETCNTTERQAEWTFSVNGNIVLTLPFATLDTPINIGIDSNYEALNLPNGIEDIVDYLEYNGTNVEQGDEIEIAVSIKNCHGLQSKISGIFNFTNQTEDPYWLTPNGETWTTLSGEPFEHL